MSKVEALYANKELMDKVGQLNLILNGEPQEDWIKVLPGTTVKYVPIQRL